MSDHSDSYEPDQCMCSPRECPYADRGDFVIYRDEYDRLSSELHRSRAELAGRMKELEKLYGLLNTTRIARDTLANFIQRDNPMAEVDRATGAVMP